MSQHSRIPSDSELDFLRNRVYVPPAPTSVAIIEGADPRRRNKESPEAQQSSPENKLPKASSPLEAKTIKDPVRPRRGRSRSPPRRGRGRSPPRRRLPSPRRRLSPPRGGGGSRKRRERSRSRSPHRRVAKSPASLKQYKASEAYRRAKARKPCKYERQKRGFCQWGDDCEFLHD